MSFPRWSNRLSQRRAYERAGAFTISLAGLAAALYLVSAAGAAGPKPFLSQFSKKTVLSSTVPGNGDQNPYGIVVAPRTAGKLHAGDILVSNFNDRGPTKNGKPTGGGNQGEGNTIVQFNSHGKHMRLFARINQKHFPGGVGLTTALAALPDGYVVVGSLPTSNGMSATAKAGALIIVSPRGRVVGRISGRPINGPWDMTSVSRHGTTTLFVTNVLNGTVAASPHVVHKGTVVRIALRTSGTGAPRKMSERVIASGFAQRTDPAALVVGPTGVGFSHGTLYVADSVKNRIAKVTNALHRTKMAHRAGITLTAGGHLNDPLGLTIAPGGDVLSANGANGDVIETTPAGHQVAHPRLDHGNGNGAGDLFGLVVPPNHDGLLFVDDFDNTLRLLH